MARAAKIAVVALFGAAGATLLAVSAVSPPASDPGALKAATATRPTAPASVPDHCRSATGPDARCAAAWDAKRRRFFGKRESGHE